MNIQHAMNISATKINDLFGRLANMPDGAAKKREAVFAELTSEIHQASEFEEKHLLPLLAKHEETKALVAAARDDNKAILRQIKELGQASKDGEAFTQGLASLHKTFQQSVRDDRKELLPAVRTVLSREEADAVTGKIQSGMAEADQARQDEGTRAKADAKAAREEVRRETEAAQAVEHTREAVEQASRETAWQAATTIRQASDALGDATREGAGRMADGMQRATASLGEAAGIYREAVSGMAGDLQAVAVASGVAVRGLVDVHRYWNEHLGTALQDGIALSQCLMRCKTGREVVEAQGDYARSVARSWLISQVKSLEATRRASAGALPTLQARLGESQQRDGSTSAGR